MSDLKWFIVIFVFLWLVWFATGGPKRAEDKYNQFVEDPQNPGDPKKIYDINDWRNR